MSLLKNKGRQSERFKCLSFVASYQTSQTAVNAVQHLGQPPQRSLQGVKETRLQETVLFPQLAYYA